MRKNIDFFKIINTWKTGSNTISNKIFNDPNFESTWSSLLFHDDITISLDKIKYTKLEILVWLAFIIHYRSDNERPTRILLPNNNDFLHFIKFTHFDDLKRDLNFKLINEFLLPSKSKYSHDKNPYCESQRITYIDRFNANRRYRNLSKNTREYLQAVYKINPNNNKALYNFFPFLKTISEITENIIIHGGLERNTGNGIIALFPAMSNEDCVTYCFSDIGNGFTKSMMINKKFIPKNFVIRDEADAILAGLLYRYWHKESGIQGLYGTLRFIADKQGTFSIMSNNALVEFDFTDRQRCELFYEKYDTQPDKKWLRDISSIYNNSFNLPGVHVRISMKLPKKRGI